MKKINLLQISLVTCASLVSAMPFAHAATKPQSARAVAPAAAASVPSAAAVEASIATTDSATTSTAATNAGLALAINHELLRFSFSHGTVSLAKGPAELSMGFLGRNAPDIFSISDVAQREAKTYHAQRTAGAVLTTLGNAAYLADLVYLIVRAVQDDNATNTDKVVFWGLLGGGLATSITGVSLTQAADGHLAKAVNLANEQIVNDIVGVSSPKLGLSVTGGRVLASANVRF